MKKTFFIALLILIFFKTIVFAETTLKAEVDKTKVSTDDALTYKVVITSSDRKIPQPTFPDFKDFAILSQAQSSTVSFVKGAAKTILVYAFILMPQKTGKLKIDPSIVKLEGNTLATQKFEIEVEQGKIKPEAPTQENQGGIPEETLPESNEPQYTL